MKRIIFYFSIIFFAAVNAQPGPTITTVELTSNTSGTLPFTLGLAFKKGDILNIPKLNLQNQQVVVKKRWNDGSVKHAIASGYTTMTAGNSLTVTISDSLAPAGTNLTAADIQSANPSASVQIGTIGTVQLSDLLANPFRTWISGPEMVEAHYRSTVGSDATLSAWFYVRLYKNGRVWIRTNIENGYLDIANATKTYVPTVTIGGNVVYNNGGNSLTQYAHTRWTAEAWIGTDPQLTPTINTAYLIESKLVPNYWKYNPSESTLNSLYQNYDPITNGGWTEDMGETGFQAQIGLLPLWDALYITSNGDSRALNSVLANAKALNSYALVWNESNTKLPTLPSNRPTWTADGENQGGNTAWGAGSLNWDIAHHGSGGYLAYMITGDYYFLETMQHQSSLVYLLNSSSQGSGTSRILKGQTRGMAWSLRTIGQLAAIAPDNDLIAADYQTLLANNMQHWKTVKDGLNGSGLGYLYEYNIDAYAPGTIAPWMEHFVIQSIGMGSDIEPLTNMTAYDEVRDWYYRGVVGILGDNTGFCFTNAGSYNIKISTGGNSDPLSWYTDWKTVETATFGTISCTNTLGGSSGGDPLNASTGYWGNLLPAIAYAVDHNAAGASDAWNRLSGATNWSSIENSGFTNTPIWGIVPREEIITSVNSPIEKNASVQLYPNPAADKIVISSIEKISIVELYDVLGEKIYSTNVLKEKTTGTIDLPKIKKGMYIIKIHSGEQVYTEKILVE